LRLASFPSFKELRLGDDAGKRSSEKPFNGQELLPFYETYGDLVNQQSVRALPIAAKSEFWDSS
jgi:hypothetical protein